MSGGQDPTRPGAHLEAGLADLVALEAHRAAAGFEPDPALLAAGWAFRFVADAQRAEECVRLYGEAGFQVRAETVHGRQIADACVSCQLVTALQFQAIYTRREQRAGAAGSTGIGGVR